MSGGKRNHLKQKVEINMGFFSKNTKGGEEDEDPQMRTGMTVCSCGQKVEVDECVVRPQWSTDTCPNCSNTVTVWIQ